MTAMTAAEAPPSLMACPTIRRAFQGSRLAEEFLAAAYDAVMAMDDKVLTHAGRVRQEVDIAESESNSAKEG